jgi:DNA-nicking Smr family endonuclease
MTRRRTGQGLSDEDRALWEHVTRRVKPMRKSTPASALGTVEPLPTTSTRSRLRAERTSTDATRPVKPAASPPRAAPAPRPVAIERRKVRRLSRGQHDIEAIIDLHGMRQAEAHAALDRFIVRAHGSGCKFVKVITGKGRNTPEHGEERGVLRRMVPHWLGSKGLARIVVGFSSAGRGHGGEGAFYVELRRKDKA